MTRNGTALLSLRDLRTYFFLDEGTVRAVDGAGLEIARGQTVGVVGESACGKSVMAYSILRLIYPPGRIVGGEIVLHRHEGDLVLTDLKQDGKAIRRLRGKEVAMIFQEPMTSLSPVHTVGGQIMEAVRLHTDMSRKQAWAHTVHMMERVGIPDAARRFRQYPHEMSGGMRQRVMIAMALSCRPALLIADEATTALDVTIEAQILELMRDLQKEFHMSILLITHDLGVIAEMADRVVVMYRGRMVEEAPVRRIFENPLHPYTHALMQSIPGITPRKEELKTIPGGVPSPFAVLPGCPFHPRCDEAVPGVCDQGKVPPLAQVAPGHQVACFRRRPEQNHD